MPGTKSKILAKILVTRRLPPNVEARLDRDYRATLNSDDRVYASAEIIAAAPGLAPSKAGRAVGRPSSYTPVYEH